VELSRRVPSDVRALAAITAERAGEPEFAPPR
jgi:hypothetical protein